MAVVVALAICIALFAVCGGKEFTKNSLKRVSGTLDAFFVQTTIDNDLKRNAQLYEREINDFTVLSNRILNSEQISYKRVIMLEAESVLPPNTYERVHERGEDCSIEYVSGYTEQPLYRRVRLSTGAYLVELRSGEYSPIDSDDDRLFNLKSAQTFELLSVAVAVERNKVYTVYDVLENGQVVKWYIDDEDRELIRQFHISGQVYNCVYTEMQFDRIDDSVFEYGVRSEQYRYDMNDVLTALYAA